MSPVIFYKQTWAQTDERRSEMDASLSHSSAQVGWIFNHGFTSWNREATRVLLSER